MYLVNGIFVERKIIDGYNAFLEHGIRGLLPPPIFNTTLLVIRLVSVRFELVRLANTNCINLVFQVDPY